MDEKTTSIHHKSGSDSPLDMLSSNGLGLIVPNKFDWRKEMDQLRDEYGLETVSENAAEQDEQEDVGERTPDVR